MGSISLVDLMGAYSALEFGVKNDAGSDQGPAINRALLMMAAMGTPNGTLFFPPGTYTIRTTVSHPSNVGAAGGCLQGRGSREAAGEGCYGTSIAGGALRGNRIGALSIESRDSTVFNSEAVRYLSANLTNPT